MSHPCNRNRIRVPLDPLSKLGILMGFSARFLDTIARVAEICSRIVVFSIQFVIVATRHANCAICRQVTLNQSAHPGPRD